jgi:tetratricopeptide (TPR) repeat protein
MGVAYHHLRKMREAEQQYREAIRLRPNYLDALVKLGVVDYVRGDYESAVSRYSKALKLQPKSVSAWRNLGACFFAMERWEDGTKAYSQALALDPQLFTPQAPGAGPTIQMLNTLSYMMFLQFAKIFAERGDSAEAMRYLEKAIDAGLKDVRMLKDEEAFKRFSNDERFARLIERMTAERSKG